MRSPSKYSSLSFLKSAQANYCKSEGGIEYCADELAQLISDKEDREFDRYSEDWWTFVDQSTEFDGWEDFTAEEVLQISEEVLEISRKVFFKGEGMEPGESVKRVKTGGRKRKVIGGWSSVILPTKLVEHIKSRGHPVSPWLTELIIREFKKLSEETK